MGGMTRVQREDFSIEQEIERVKAASTKIGGIAVFIGTAREYSAGQRIKKLVYEHYSEMAEKKLAEVRENAMRNFEILEACIVHRIGEIDIGENIVLIIAAAEHRKDAFKACKWCIDELKKVVPIWKKEIMLDGERWVQGEGR